MERFSANNNQIFLYLKERLLELSTDDEKIQIETMLQENLQLSLLRQILFLAQSKIPESLYANYEIDLNKALMEENSNSAIQRIAKKYGIEISIEEMEDSLQKGFKEINGVLYEEIISLGKIAREEIDADIEKIKILNQQLSSSIQNKRLHNDNTI